MNVSAKTVTLKSVGGFGRRKVKVGSFSLVLALALLLNISIFMALYLVGRPPRATFLPTFGPPKLNYSFSIMGEADKMLVKPMGIRIEGNRIYVSDTLNRRIQVFNLDGGYLFDFGEDGTGPGEFQFPYGIEVAPSGEIFVSDFYNGDISVFDKNGYFLRYFALYTDMLIQPSGLLISGGKMYVTNLSPGYVLVFDLASEELLNIIGAGELDFPNDLTRGPDGNLYISDTGNDRIQVYTPDGDLVRTLAVDSQLVTNPRGLVFGARGELYVVSKLNNEVVILDNSGNFAGSFGDDIFNLPNGIAVDRKGRVYVTDHISVVVFD
ncbi:MAG: 6-bladed beta-propeller [Dethiobacter sp.]|jgi:DNA-binding beta-propeller fold protein YncE|nr:6-bladed beta-propeller [Dethiobacter sp.]